MAVDLPHFAAPFHFSGSSAAVVDQDSRDEVAACVWAVLCYPLDTLPDSPEFGVPEQAFRQDGPVLDEIRQAIVTNEPRAHAVIGIDDDSLADFATTVGVQL